MSCEFTFFDGSYVLGALSPADRQEFERHLDSCPECARSVREFAGLPGLLARVDAEVLDRPFVPGSEPATLLPALVREVRRTQRHRVYVTAGLAAAAVVTIAGGTFAVVSAGGDSGASPSASVSASAGAAMTPVGQHLMTANLAFETVPWGTRLELTCSYAAGRDYEGAAAKYAMYVHTRDGKVEQVATWNALPGKTMKLAAATAARRSDISSVEVRTVGGTPVLRTTNPS